MEMWDILNGGYTVVIASRLWTNPYDGISTIKGALFAWFFLATKRI